VGPLPEATPEVAPGSREPVRPVREHVATAAELTAEIRDEHLREIVAKTAALSLARAASDR
jgi:hypothetical protein